MSRKREEKRRKKAEMERQLGDAAADVDTARLRERERVTTPELRLAELRSPGGLRGLLTGGPPAVVVAVYVVEASGARLIDAVEVGERKQRLERVSYTRPAHFLLIAVTTRDADATSSALASAGASAHIDGEPLDSGGFREEAWETPRVAKLDGVEGHADCAALSVPGVGRAMLTTELTLGRATAVLEMKL
jgi:hypothetical protein